MRKNIRDAVADIIRAHQNRWWANPDDSIYHNIKVMQAMEHSF
jgi:hypothetical protein